jgi:hypothetical protein
MPGPGKSRMQSFHSEDYSVDKLFVIPWGALELDAQNKRFILDIDKDMLEDAPGFDKDNWPETTEREWLVDVFSFYGHDPYWE